MVESLLALCGVLQLGSLPVGIAAGVLANWLWSKLQGRPVIHVEVILKTQDAERLVAVPTENRDAMAAALAAAIQAELTKADR
jgi:hypothetical protein